MAYTMVPTPGVMYYNLYPEEENLSMVKETKMVRNKGRLKANTLNSADMSDYVEFPVGMAQFTPASELAQFMPATELGQEDQIVSADVQETAKKIRAGLSISKLLFIGLLGYGIYHFAIKKK